MYKRPVGSRPTTSKPLAEKPAQHIVRFEVLIEGGEDDILSYKKTMVYLLERSSISQKLKASIHSINVRPA